MDSAIKSYNKGFMRSSPDRVYFEIEEFMQWVLEENPGIPQIWFCLGLINFKGKGDDELAKLDFERFLADERSLKYPNAFALAQRYLDEINIPSTNQS